jgi:hypothetical protein
VPHSSLTWLMTTLERSERSRPHLSSRRRARARIAILGAVACLALPAAAAQAAPLPLEQAEAEATRAVAPQAVENVVCVRQPGARGRGAQRRAVCLVAHPAAEGSICRSFVLVAAPRGSVTAARPIRTRIGALNACMTLAASTEAGR